MLPSIQRRRKEVVISGVAATTTRSVMWGAHTSHNKHSILSVTTTILSSKFNISETKTKKLVNICSNVNATCYISGVSGHDYLDEELFLQSNIKLIYENFIHPKYNQIHGGFIENMSIIDLLMNTGERSRKILSDTKNF